MTALAIAPPISRGLWSEEARIASYLQTARPDLLDAFLGHLDEARRSILHRLFQAVVRENIAGLAEQVTWANGGRTLRLTVAPGLSLQATVTRRHSLGRFDLAGDVWRVAEAGDARPLSHPCELLDLIRDHHAFDMDLPPLDYDRFAAELENSAANYALALAGAAWRGGRLRAEADRRGIHTSLEWVRVRRAEDEMFSPLLFYEQWVVDGHPLHPGAKIKLGMDAADVIRYSPEWEAAPAIRLVAIARRACRVVVAEDEEGSAALLAREDPALMAQVERCLIARGAAPADYELIPMHPWQWDHTLPVLYADAIRGGEVIPLPDMAIPALAQMSVRTLAPVQPHGAGRHHVKTAINVQTTGAVRTVSPQAAENGPMLSRLFEEIQQREPWFGTQLVLLREPVGVHYVPPPHHPAEERERLAKNLAALFRENAEDHVRDGELPLPGSALLAVSPISGRPVAVELIEQFAATPQLKQIQKRWHGLDSVGAGLRPGPLPPPGTQYVVKRSTGRHRGRPLQSQDRATASQNCRADLSDAAVAFIARYAEVAVPPFLRLMTRYGVGLEGHLQNSIPVFRDGQPVRMLVRDLGGVRVLPERLARQGLAARFHSGSATCAADADDLRNKVFYAFFQNHLGGLFAELARWLDVDEAALWRPVAAICRATFRQLAADPALCAQAADDEAAWFRPVVALKAMVTMRLLDQVTRYSFSDVPNPLADAGSAG